MFCCFKTGKKGRVLEQEIKDLVEERNLLTEKKRRPLYRKVSELHYINYSLSSQTLICFLPLEKYFCGTVIDGALNIKFWQN